MDRFIDIHCHPSLKPFGKACPGNTNNSDASLPDSIWHNDPPTAGDKILNRSLKVTRFSQSSFTDLHLGKFKIVVVALYPIEKGFFSGRIGTRDFADIIYNFPAGIGSKKIDFIQENNDDFSELNCEYDYYRQLDDMPLKIYGKDVRYRLTSDFTDIESNLAGTEDVISVVLSIEGAGSFSNDISRPPDQNLLLSNIDKVKKWQHPPLFVSLCHHFDNYMAGHAHSFPCIIGRLVDQTSGIDRGINSCGEAVIRSLLNESDGRRIYIDIKHMSRKSRIRYYEILHNEYGKEKIPIIVSHGALNGRPSLNDGDRSGGKRNKSFDSRDINFYDEEIVKIADSRGYFWFAAG